MSALWLEQLRSVQPCGEGECDHAGEPARLCEQCARYVSLLRSAREVYAGARWRVTLDGRLQDVE